MISMSHDQHRRGHTLDEVHSTQRAYLRVNVQCSLNATESRTKKGVHAHKGQSILENGNVDPVLDDLCEEADV